MVFDRKREITERREFIRVEDKIGVGDMMTERKKRTRREKDSETQHLPQT